MKVKKYLWMALMGFLLGASLGSVGALAQEGLDEEIIGEYQIEGEHGLLHILQWIVTKDNEMIMAIQKDKIKDTNIRIVKMAADGDIKWRIDLDNDINITDIIATKNGEYFGVGIKVPEKDFLNSTLFVIKFDGDGKIVWQDNCQKINVNVTDAVVELGGKYYISCHSQYDTTKDCLIMYDQDGQSTINKTVGEVTDLVSTDDQTLLGIMDNTKDTLVKFDLDGQLLWEKDIDADESINLSSIIRVEDYYVAVGSIYKDYEFIYYMYGLDKDGKQLWKKELTYDSHMFHQVKHIFDMQVVNDTIYCEGYAKYWSSHKYFVMTFDLNGNKRNEISMNPWLGNEIGVFDQDVIMLRIQMQRENRYSIIKKTLYKYENMTGELSQLSPESQKIISEAEKIGLIQDKDKIVYNKMITREAFADLMMKVYSLKVKTTSSKIPYKALVYAIDKNILRSYITRVMMSNGDYIYRPNSHLSIKEAHFMCYWMMQRLTGKKIENILKMHYTDIYTDTPLALEAKAYLNERNIIDTLQLQGIHVLECMTWEEAIILISRMYQAL